MKTSQETGLWKRGLVLLVLMGALAAVVLWTVLQQPDLPAREAPARPGPVVLLTGSAGLPGALSWGSLYQIGELLPSTPGWEIRYNAALALARLGSRKAPLDVLGEMLDEARQMRNFRTRLPDGRHVTDEAAARRTVLGALRALRDWHRHAGAVKAADPNQLASLYQSVSRLAESSNRVIRAEAEETRLVLQKT